MTFPAYLACFLSVLTTILLIYNFLSTVLFSMKKELLVKNKNVQKLQKTVLILICIGIFIHVYYVADIKAKSTHFLVIPWIWGFLTAHVFLSRKSTWLNELLGLGILLAITIVLYFKQTELIQLFTKCTSIYLASVIYILYGSMGFVLGRFLWTKSFEE